MDTDAGSAVLTEYIWSLEESLLDPVVRQSPAAVADLLADDFTEFGSSGREFNKAQILDALQDAPPATMAVTDMRATRLADTVVLLTYRVRREGNPAAFSLRSSVWQLRGEKWQIVFHQGTRTAEQP